MIHFIMPKIKPITIIQYSFIHQLCIAKAKAQAQAFSMHLTAATEPDSRASPLKSDLFLRRPHIQQYVCDLHLHLVSRRERDRSYTQKTETTFALGQGRK